MHTRIHRIGLVELNGYFINPCSRACVCVCVRVCACVCVCVCVCVCCTHPLDTPLPTCMYAYTISTRCLHPLVLSRCTSYCIVFWYALT